MKLARVILFTGRMDAMSEFYGTVLGLKQVTSEKGWREFGERGQRSCFTLKMSPHCAKSWWCGERNLVRYDREKYFAFATARIRMGIPFNYPTADD